MIIGIGHRMRSGKDTLAKMISEEIGSERCYMDSFAKGLKDTILQLFPMVKKRHVYGDDKNEIIPGVNIRGNPCSARDLMQYFGTEVCRRMYADIWVNQLIARASMQTKIVICTDVRFPNEASAIKANNGILIKVEREGSPHSDHESENLLSNYSEWDFIVSNNGTLEDLREEVRRIVNECNGIKGST